MIHRLSHHVGRPLLHAAEWLIQDRKGTSLWFWTAGAVLFGAAILYVLDRYLTSRQRRRLVLTCTFLAGWFYALEYLIPGHKLPGSSEEVNFMTPAIQPVGYACSVIGSFALAMGIINLSRIHYANIAKKRSGWYNSMAFFVAVLTMMIVATLNEFATKGHVHGHLNDVYKSMYDIVFGGFQQPLGASVFASLGFYITTAAYRAFRIKSREATILLISGFIVMMGQVPIGNFLTSWIHPQWEIGSFLTSWIHPGSSINGSHGFHLANLRIEKLSYWILTVPNAAAIRAISFGLEIGGVAMCLRMWFSLERGSYYDKEF